jgi:hypothetical protein
MVVFSPQLFDSEIDHRGQNSNGQNEHQPFEVVLSQKTGVMEDDDRDSDDIKQDE